MSSKTWIINPFDEAKIANVVLQEELLELNTNEELNVKFQRLWEIARKVLTTFPSSCRKKIPCCQKPINKKAADLTSQNEETYSYSLYN